MAEFKSHIWFQTKIASTKPDEITAL